jgi:hypothetical protein
MSTLTGQYIADGAWTKVNEQTGAAAVRWPVAEALRWINDGQREIVNQSPRAYTKSVKATAAAGTRQDFASLSMTDAVQLVDIPRNFRADGTTPGRAMTKRDRIEFDEQIPTWHSTAAAADAVHWMFDDRDPLAFYIYPPVTAGSKLEIIYAASPADLGSLAATITIPDIYANALQFFVLFSFYSKDATYAKSPGLASAAWQLFQQSLGIRGQNVQIADTTGNQKAAS